MKKYRILLIIPVILIIVINYSCESWRNCYEGNGIITTEQRILSDFYGVVSSGDIDVIITQDTIYSVTVRTDENLQSVIRTNVKGDMLYVEVSRDRCIRSGSVPVIYVSMPVLYEVENQGSGKIYSEGIIYSTNLDIIVSGSGDLDMYVDVNRNLRIFMNGSGDLDLYGVADIGYLRIGGSGDIHACDCEFYDCYITIDGSGDANVYVNNYINVEINGSGDVNYIYDGIPPTTRFSGFGSGIIHEGRCY